MVSECTLHQITKLAGAGKNPCLSDSKAWMLSPVPIWNSTLLHGVRGTGARKGKPSTSLAEKLVVRVNTLVLQGHRRSWGFIENVSNVLSSMNAAILVPFYLSLNFHLLTENVGKEVTDDLEHILKENFELEKKKCVICHVICKILSRRLL